MLHRPLEFRAT